VDWHGEQNNNQISEYRGTSLADRLLVIYHGRIVGEVDPKQATHEEIGLLMTGGNKD